MDWQSESPITPSHLQPMTSINREELSDRGKVHVVLDWRLEAKAQYLTLSMPCFTFRQSQHISLVHFRHIASRACWEKLLTWISFFSSADLSVRWAYKMGGDPSSVRPQLHFRLPLWSLGQIHFKLGGDIPNLFSHTPVNFGLIKNVFVRFLVQS